MTMKVNVVKHYQLRIGCIISKTMEVVNVIMPIVYYIT